MDSSSVSTTAGVSGRRARWHALAQQEQRVLLADSLRQQHEDEEDGLVYARHGSTLTSLVSESSLSLLLAPSEQAFRRDSAAALIYVVTR